VNHVRTGTRNSGYPRNSGYERVDKDWYVEPRWCVHQLLDHESFEGEILDPCCGGGTIPSVCLERGLDARGSDIVNRGFGTVEDLFTIIESTDNIISNVPYGIAETCVRHVLKITRDKAALILPMPFWESARRQPFFQEHKPIRWYPCVPRPSMPPGQRTKERDRFGAMIQPKASGGTMPYGWFIFEAGYQGPTTVCHFRPWKEET
jgi:hypothetical protein